MKSLKLIIATSLASVVLCGSAMADTPFTPTLTIVNDTPKPSQAGEPANTNQVSVNTTNCQGGQTVNPQSTGLFHVETGDAFKRGCGITIAVKNNSLKDPKLGSGPACFGLVPKKYSPHTATGYQVTISVSSYDNEAGYYIADVICGTTSNDADPKTGVNNVWQPGTACGPGITFSTALNTGKQYNASKLLQGLKVNFHCIK